MKLKKLGVMVLIAVSTLFISPPAYSQVTDSNRVNTVLPVTAPSLVHDTVVLHTIDSVLATIPISQITAPSTVTIFGLKLPVWAGIAIIALMIVLPGVQLILKKIPSAAPIEGVIGVILNFFTAFQKNIVVTPNPPDKTT